MSTEEHIAQLTAQVAALQAQLAHHSQSPPPPQPSAAPAPTPKPPKVVAPTPFSGAQDNLDHFKAECSLYLSMRSCQGASETGNVSHPIAHRTPTDLRNGHSRGRIPAECLERKS